MRRFLLFLALLAGASAFAADRHVFLDTTGAGKVCTGDHLTSCTVDGDCTTPGGTCQPTLNQCPNPSHNTFVSASTGKLQWCDGGGQNRKAIGDRTGYVSTSDCTGGGGTVRYVQSNTTSFPMLVDIDIDGTAERIHGHPQACVYYMAKSDSCEVHAGTYRKPGAQCNANCGDFSTGSDSGDAGLGQCHDWNCWMASVVAMGFGPNLDGTGYGTAANPGYLRGAVMGGSTDTWDANGDKVPGDGTYSPILTGDSNVTSGAVGTFNATSCSGSGNCSGDHFYAAIVGCGGLYSNTSGKILCSLNRTGSEEWVKVDSDASGTFDAELNAVSGAPCPNGSGNCTSPGNGTRPVDHFIIKDIEFTRYNQGPTSVANQGGRQFEANINLNGDGAADGLKLDHIALHTNAYGQSGRGETYHAHIADMQNRNCVDYTEVKNSYLEQTNRLLFGDEGSPHPTLGCSWRIHDNRILVNVQGYEADYTPAIGFFKSIDHHMLDLRPKTIRFYNNEVIYKQASAGSTNTVYGFQFGQFGGACGGSETCRGLGEFWLYGNIFRVHSSPGPLLQRFFPSSCDVDCAPPCSQSWRFYYFNNTWDSWSSSTPTELNGLFFGQSAPGGNEPLGELFVGKNNVQVFTTEEPSASMTNPPFATTKTYGNNISGTHANDSAVKCAGTSSRLFACGSDPLVGSGLSYYAPYSTGALINAGSCDPDGDGAAGFDTDGDGDQDLTWVDIAGNTVNCPNLSTFITAGAIQAASVAAVCGNSIIESGETCDDGDATSCDGCSSTCQTEVGFTCGDGTRLVGCETCDDGDTVTETACDYGAPGGTCTLCNATCSAVLNLTGPYCGDNVLGTIYGEVCDTHPSYVLTQTCASLGFGGGTLLCATDCMSYNTSGCTAGEPPKSLSGVTLSGAKVQ